jgi:uncharacterized protein
MDPLRRRRLKRWTIGLAVLLLLGLDMARPPRDQLSARFLVGSIHLYQATLSPLIGMAGVHCRFKPTCSHYGEGAIRKYGTWTGTWKTLWRIVRCGPWTPDGTVDPP